MPLPTDFVQHRTGKGFVLETGVVWGDVEIGLSLLQVHWDGDLSELEAPVVGKELEILYGRYRRGPRRARSVQFQQSANLWPSHGRRVRFEHLLDHELDRASRPATRHHD
ncbi:MAG: hypothetical protein ACLPUG_02440 [Acidimicrobiales bacterium]